MNNWWYCIEVGVEPKFWVGVHMGRMGRAGLRHVQAQLIYNRAGLMHVRP